MDSKTPDGSRRIIEPARSMRFNDIHSSAPACKTAILGFISGIERGSLHLLT
jgi:hypothetical protein